MIARLTGALLLALPLPAGAQVAQTNLRYDEDWSAARGLPNRDAHWWERLKDRPLSADRSVYVTLGAEARARYEGFDNNNWGQPPAPDDGYLWLRFMPLADLHAGPVRAFVQGIAGYARGVRPGAGPADATGLDVLQAFADVRLPLGDDAALTLRGGRELIGLGSERLVGLRYGPNIPQPFDGVRLSLEQRGVRVEALHTRPVSVRPGDFDDRTSPTKRLNGVYATVPLADGAAADLYWLGYRDDRARFGAAPAHERRDTYGLRLFGRRGALGWNWEAMLQGGRFGSATIRAWSIASETSYAFSAPLAPRFRLRANMASGDRDRNDDRLGTFNALFPKGKYFGELSPIGPRNIVNLHPSVDVDLGRGFTAELAGIAYWRASRRDGLYDVPGQLIRAPGDSNARHIGNQIELLVGWQANTILSFSLSASLFTAGQFLRETGPARPIHMVGAETMLRF
ncbi:alginate export family protein [Sphingomonas jatrophae]|uniref:Alginate export n=1 Tax=Sphingomonas jatrophae TaxID=1166337 RepID=A0A1I6KZN9_9SPHN|nr:alginate export family protein [Sphingomonas jatrophae]SFR96664.1 Alginate export [Sphingomonas jatrophae]